jgi:hypothetical protein
MINACTTVPELQALYVYNDATPPVRPLPVFPTTTLIGVTYGYFNTTSNYFSNPACINQKIQTSSLEENRS